MPCPHKFQAYLNLEKLDFEPNTLIVGTFNPAWPEGNYAEWFYGRIRNNYFWDVLPRMYQSNLNLRQKPIQVKEWKKFCRENGIAITDLIYCIHDAESNNVGHQRVLKSYSDASISNYFSQIEFTDILGLLKRHPSIRHTYLTTQAKIEAFNLRWIEVEDFGRKHGIMANRLLTPSASARFQMGDYKKENPHDKTPLRNFIYQKWLDVWHN